MEINLNNGKLKIENIVAEQFFQPLQADNYIVVKRNYKIMFERTYLSNTQSPLDIAYIIYPEYSTIKFNSIIIFFGFPSKYKTKLEHTSIDILEFTYYSDYSKFQYIEKRRTNDIPLLINLVLRVVPLVNKTLDLPNENIIEVQINEKISQANWTEFLKQINYGEKMIIEIEKPKLEGFNETLNFIESAQRGFETNRSPSDIVSDLRKAWDSLDTFFNTYISNIQQYINGNSQREENNPSKYERVEKIRKDAVDLVNTIINLKRDVDKFVQIGPHENIYEVTRDDALLAYRLTISIMEYYSKILKTISNEKGLE